MVEIDSPYKSLHFRRFLYFFKDPGPLKNIFVRLNNSACNLIETSTQRCKNTTEGGFLSGFFFQFSWISNRGGGYRSGQHFVAITNVESNGCSFLWMILFTYSCILYLAKIRQQFLSNNPQNTVHSSFAFFL